MEKLKNEIELIGGDLFDTSDGVFVRAYSKAEIKQIQELFNKYPKYSLGCFVECKIYEWFYYEALIIE
jgi:hypothetical protein